MMRYWLFNYLAPLALLLLLSSSLSAEDQFPGVEELMSEVEFEQSGLSKLSTDELRHLNNWLISYTANEAPTLRKVSPEVKKVEKETVILSHIDGEFNGWSGKTIFKLANGQVWKQRLSGSWRYSAQSPEVEIKQNFMGFYMMRVDNKKKIGVTRIR
jgi:hypothetical protein